MCRLRTCAVAVFLSIAGIAAGYHLGDEAEYHCWALAGHPTAKKDDEVPCPEGVIMSWPINDEGREMVVNVPKTYVAYNWFSQEYLDWTMSLDNVPTTDLDQSDPTKILHANFHMCKVSSRDSWSYTDPCSTTRIFLFELRSLTFETIDIYRLGTSH